MGKPLCLSPHHPLVLSSTINSHYTNSSTFNENFYLSIFPHSINICIFPTSAPYTLEVAAFTHDLFLTLD